MLECSLIDSLLFGLWEYGVTSSRIDFSAVERSMSVTRPGRSPWRFPTRADYVRFLIAKKEVDMDDDMATRPELARQLQLDWHLRAQHGCRFAQILAKDATQLGWGAIVVQINNHENIKGLIAGEVRNQLHAAIGSPDVLAVSVLFPGISTPDALINLLFQLQTELGWTLSVPGEDTFDPGDGRPPLKRVLVRVTLSESVLSWALGFGPFDFLPVTRRAPLTEIAFAVKPKVLPLRSSRLNADPATAHLADVPVPIEDALFDRLWADTEQGKKLLLGRDDDPTAKAKVTFAVPAILWESLYKRQTLHLALID